MRKILLIDGNSMLFRAYYGTLSRGYMKSSSGVVTNAVYGFSIMLNRAFEILNPTHVMVAFDTKEKTFRHKMYESYKGTRKEVDEELVSQFKLVREFLDAMSILRCEVVGYEADDIIGTVAKHSVNDHVTVLTSDKDLLQIIDSHVDVLLMKKGLTDLVRMDVKALKDTMNLIPSQIVDLKALMGDSSDNIPGVPSVGEKTAVKLLDTYENLNGVYEHQDEIKGKLGEKIREFKDQAYLSYELATIFCDVPMDIDMSIFELKPNLETLNAFYRQYDMNSLLVNIESKEITDSDQIRLVDFEVFKSCDVLTVHVMDLDGSIEGAYISDGKNCAYIDRNKLISDSFVEYSKKTKLVLTNAKGVYRSLLEANISFEPSLFDDILVLGFIVDGSITTLDKLKDAYSLWNHNLEKKEQEIHTARLLMDTWNSLNSKAVEYGVQDVYLNFEKPLISVLAKCEYYGFSVDQSVLDKIATETQLKLDELSSSIYSHAGLDFNINSPKQLATVLFDTLGLPTGKKRSTAVDVLEKLYDKHPIIEYLLQYRKYQKLYSTYAVGLVKHIGVDGKIHTTLNQHNTQTGRLSSSNPNLQNISVRDEEGKLIRSAFVASEGCQLLCIDYSQIELRVLAYLSDEKKMIDAFAEGRDIHEETAKEIFNVETVTSRQRREAKSVNFGIVYGMSEFGLSQQLDISFEDARAYLDRHEEIYPNLHKYMAYLIEQCKKQGYVETYFKRRRFIPEINDKNHGVREFGKRAAMNAPIQGTAADIIKLAMIQVDAFLDSYKTNMILQVHDELIFDVFNDEVDAVKDHIVDIMESVVDWPVKMKVSTSLGKTWMD